MENEVVLYGGTYLNKGGAAIAQGTLEVLEKLNISFNVIIDPEPPLEKTYKDYDLRTIYRYSDLLASKEMPSISPAHTFKPFVKCLMNSRIDTIKELKGIPIWHIGDSPFSDQRSYLSILGQVIALRTLESAMKSKVIIGGISLDYPRTRVGGIALKNLFRKHVDFSFLRGQHTYENVLNLGVSSEKMSMICDFAFHLNGEDSQLVKDLSSVHELDKPSIALIFREYSSGEERQDYINNIKELTLKLEKQGYQVFYVPTSYAYLLPENDDVFVKNVLKPDSDKVINIRDLSPGEIISLFSKFDAVISARLHGAVYGTLANVPTIHLYEGYKSLEVIGDVFTDSVPLSKISDFTKKSGFDKIIEILDGINENDIQTQLKSKIEVARKSSLKILKDDMDRLLEV